MEFYQKNKERVNECIALLDANALEEMASEGLLKLSVELGLCVVHQLMESDATQLAGEKGKHNKEKTAYRHGTENTSVVLGAQKVRIRRPRVRSKEGVELPIQSLALFQSEDPLRQAVLERLLSGVSTRKFSRSVDYLEPDARGVSKSEINRIFIEEKDKQMDEFFKRPIEEDYIALMLDGLSMGEMTVIGALGITVDGHKRMLGLIEGGSENADVVKSLLSDLIDRGLKRERARLFVLDGGKALSKAVSDTFGKYAVIQRCQVHKKRNVLSHLPKAQQDTAAKELGTAYKEEDYEIAKAKLEALAANLSKYPSAMGSLLEGMEETLTVNQLGLTGFLRETLATTNPLESANAGCRRITRRADNIQNGAMAIRQAVAGFMEVERGFHRIRGYSGLPALDEALTTMVLGRLDNNAAA